MKELKLNVCQPNTAIGKDKSSMSIRYVVRVNEKEVVIVNEKEKDDIFSEFCPTTTLAYKVIIHHPYILWGTQREIDNDFNRAILSLPELRDYQEAW